MPVRERICNLNCCNGKEESTAPWEPFQFERLDSHEVEKAKVRT